jgi:hypothetical protein
MNRQPMKKVASRLKGRGEFGMRNQRWRHTPKRPTGLYLQYLNDLIAKREAKGLPPPKDATDQNYWDAWRKNNQMPVEKKVA